MNDQFNNNVQITKKVFIDHIKRINGNKIFTQNYIHPSMVRYTNKFSFYWKWHEEITFNLEQIYEQFIKSMNAINHAVLTKKNIIIVSFNPIHKLYVEEVATKSNISFINSRWVGGFLSNFYQILSCIWRYHRINTFLLKHTKFKIKKNVLKDFLKYKTLFWGINLKNYAKPSLVILISHLNQFIVDECVKNGVKVISLLNSNQNAFKIHIPLPINDLSYDAVKFILKYFISII